jgi:bacillithiol synthase
MKIVARDNPKLYQETSLVSFLGISPIDPKGWDKSVAEIGNRTFARDDLSDILVSYNKAIGNDEAALEQIKAFRNRATYCVFTGQQLGFMGGPAYTILKAISCLSLAKKHNAMPIFWLATEDHDIHEIDHTYLIEAQGNLKKFHLSFPQDGRPVENLEIHSDHLKIVKAFLQAIEYSDFYEELAQEKLYARMMARVLVKLFQGTGLVFLEPYLLRSLAKPFFKKEISDSEKIAHILQETTQRYQNQGGKAQLQISQGTNLFFKMKGLIRTKIKRWNGSFFCGTREWHQEEILQSIEESSESFSVSAAARVVLQSFLFPTAAYIAGPAEIAYYHQLKEYHEYYGISMPWLVPRLSATMITPEAGSVLNKCGLNPWDAIPLHWENVIPELEKGIGELGEDWLEAGRRHLSEDISDEALVTFVRNCQQRLQRKIIKLRMKRKRVSSHSLHYLRNLIFPHKKNQERVINWWEFQSHTKENLILQLLEKAQVPFPGHLYCYL